MKYFFQYTFLSIFLVSCTTSPPKNPNNICQVFYEKENWYKQAKAATKRWGLPIHINMAIMHQESRFVADAEPPRPTVLGFIPWFRRSSAYGYPQAQDAAWGDYLKGGGNWGADRDEFSDACDFIGWYCATSRKRLGTSLWDAENLYLAYHEGHGGYQRKTYLKKPWLMKVAKKVAKKSRQFSSQLSTCKKELESTSRFFW